MDSREGQRVFSRRYARSHPAAVLSLVEMLWTSACDGEAKKRRDALAQEYLRTQNVRNVSVPKLRDKMREQLRDAKRALTFASNSSAFVPWCELWLLVFASNGKDLGPDLTDSGAGAPSPAVSTRDIDRVLESRAGKAGDALRVAVIALLACGRLRIASARSSEELATRAADADNSKHEGQTDMTSKETKTTLDEIRAMIDRVDLEDRGWSDIERLIEQLRARKLEADAAQARGAQIREAQRTLDVLWVDFEEVVTAVGHERLEVEDDYDDLEDLARCVAELRGAYEACRTADKAIEDAGGNLRLRYEAIRRQVLAQARADKAYRIIIGESADGETDEGDEDGDDEGTADDSPDDDDVSSGEVTSDTSGDETQMSTGEATVPSTAPHIGVVLALAEQDHTLRDDLIAAAPKKTNLFPDAKMCLDFGTARSKSMVVRDNGRPIFLNIGHEPDSAYQFSVASSVWIDSTSRQVYFGDQAIKRSLAAGGARQRIDSLKRLLGTSTGALEAALSAPVSAASGGANGITYRDVILVYLGYFVWATETAVRANKDLAGSRRVLKRRYTIPSWNDDRGERTAVLGDLLSRGTLIADWMSSRGRSWSDGLTSDEFLRISRAALAIPVDRLPRWLFDEAVSEPCAAVGTHSETLRIGARLLLVIDVGAGTTDFGLFLVTPPSAPIERSRDSDDEPPVRMSLLASRSENMAGDTIDECLRELILTRAGASSSRSTIALEVSQRQRQWKEDVFKAGKMTHRFQSGRDVKVTRDELMREPAMTDFSKMLTDSVQSMLQTLENEAATREQTIDWSGSYPEIRLFATGGGAQLPMVTELDGRPVSLRRADGTQVEVTLRRTDEIPVSVRAFGVTADVFLPLAVSWGGAMPELPHQRSEVHLRRMPVGTRPDLSNAIAVDSAGRRGSDP